MKNIDSATQERIKQWLSDEYDQETIEKIKALQNANNENELIDAFYKDLAFGTGGLRGVMGIGPNRINKYTVGKATQGLANFLLNNNTNEEVRVAVSYDSRNNSKEFAKLVANVFSANNIKVFLFNELRPTPMLSFAIRHFRCHSGVMLTASHNPKEYNGYKAYWSDGCQLVAPQDQQVIDEVNKIKSVKDIKFTPIASNITLVDEKFDNIYIEANKKLSLSPKEIANQKDLKIVYSSIHGTGISIVPAMLKSWGFNQVHLVEEQATPDGNFPTVKYPNPEEEDAMQMAINKGAEVDADIVLATDPDADRVGLAVKNSKGAFQLLNGNQIGSLLTHYILSVKHDLKDLKPNDYIVLTIVTSNLIADIANKFNVKAYHTLTGFKYIGNLITSLLGKEQFLVGGEESYGYLIGDLVRDKDAVNSCAFIAEMAAYYKDKGKSLFDILLELYTEHGFYHEKLISLTKEGKSGSEEIEKMMENLRADSPKELFGIQVQEVRDYLNQSGENLITKEKFQLDLPQSNVLQFLTVDGDIISARPSGTEPKIKFYCSVKNKRDTIENYSKVLGELENKIKGIMQDIIKE